jgi:uncharacterized membrane protein HdeD (DUF308 family)
MTQPLRPDPADFLGRLGRHWGWALAFGIITVIAGVVALAWPGPTLLVIAILFGIELVWLGVFRFVAAFGHDVNAGTRILGAVELFTALSHSEVPHRAWLIFMGILSIIAGLILLAYPGISLVVLYVIVGIWLLVFGFMEISIAWQMRAASHRMTGHEAHAT